MILTPRGSLVVAMMMLLLLLLLLLLESLRFGSEQRSSEVVFEVRNLRSLVDSGFGLVRLLGRALDWFFRFGFNDRINLLGLQFN
jgi:hypothetical protein